MRGPPGDLNPHMLGALSGHQPWNGPSLCSRGLQENRDLAVLLFLFFILILILLFFGETTLPGVLPPHLEGAIGAARRHRGVVEHGGVP